MSRRSDAREVINNLAFVKSHGIEIVSIEDGVTKVRMPFRSEFSTTPDLFPTAIVGMVGDVAAIGACFADAPADHACATLDYTVKNTGLAAGEALYAEGRTLMTGKTISVGSADVYVMRAGQKHHCGTVLATARVYRMKGERSSTERE